MNPDCITSKLGLSADSTTTLQGVDTRWIERGDHTRSRTPSACQHSGRTSRVDRQGIHSPIIRSTLSWACCSLLEYETTTEALGLSEFRLVGTESNLKKLDVHTSTQRHLRGKNTGGVGVCTIA
jgi:hypothetical protein